MCGRFTQRRSWAELHELMTLIGSPHNLGPRYNVAPGQDVAVVRASGAGRQLSMLRWGLVPGWAHDPAIGSRLINARAETAAEKPAFRDAWRARRCLVPADGFYEWRRGSSAPWLFEACDGFAMVFAGLWERWRPPVDLDPAGTGAVLETFTILTTEANATVRPVHRRMPVILAPDMVEAWLAGAAVPLGPAPDTLVSARRVSPRVNDPRHDDPECVSSYEEIGLPLPVPPQPEQTRGRKA